MTRKRFVKLMMAKGYSKRRAVAIASQVDRYGSYDKLMSRYRPSGAALRLADISAGIDKACAKLDQGLARAGAALGDLLRSVGKALTATVTGIFPVKQYGPP